MAEESLEAKIEQRKKEAVEKEIGVKGSLVIELLGVSRSTGYRTKECRVEKNNVAVVGESSYHEKYSDPDGSYSCDSGWYFSQDVTITYKGETVFDGSNSSEPSKVELYVPGKWEKVLDSLYSQAKEKQKQESDAKEAELKKNRQNTEEELKNKWKL